MTYTTEQQRIYMREYRKRKSVQDRESAYRKSPQRKAAVAKWLEANGHKDKAKAKVRNALRDNRLKRLDACECCGSQGSLEGHHTSYAEDMWLCVTWLCIPCHKQLHMEANRRMENEKP